MNLSKIKTFQSWLIVLAAIFFIGNNFSINASISDPSGQDKVEIKFEDEDLIHFVEANREISALRRDMNNDISELVEQEGLTMERFNQIARASQIGVLDSGTFTSDEIAAFNSVAPMVTELRRQNTSISQALLAEKGLTSQLYQEILQDYRQNNELQVYVRELLRERARQEAFERRKQELIEERGLTEEEAEELIIRRSEAEREN